MKKTKKGVELWKEEKVELEPVELHKFVNPRKAALIEQVVDDLNAKDRWKIIEKHFQTGEFIGEDDVTNFVRLACAVHPNFDKFCWLNSCAAGLSATNLNYSQWLENYSKNSEILFIPHLKKAHFCLWIYYIKEHALSYVDPFNAKYDDDRRERIILIIFSLFDIADAPVIHQQILKVMKQEDFYNCGIICCDVILCFLKGFSLASICNYDPDDSRKSILELFKRIKEDNVIPAYMLLNGLPDILLPPLKELNGTISSFGSSILIIDETAQRDDIQNGTLETSSFVSSTQKESNCSKYSSKGLMTSSSAKDLSSTINPSTTHPTSTLSSLFHDNTSVLAKKLDAQKMKAQIQFYQLGNIDLEMKILGDEESFKEKLEKFKQMKK